MSARVRRNCHVVSHAPGPPPASLPNLGQLLAELDLDGPGPAPAGLHGPAHPRWGRRSTITAAAIAAGHASQCTSAAMNASPLTGLTLQDDAARHSPHSRVAAA